jgi:hypothetical protein
MELIKDLIREAKIEIKENKEWNIKLFHDYSYKRSCEHNIHSTKKASFIMGCFHITLINNSDNCNNSEENIIIGYIDKLYLIYNKCNIEIRWQEKYTGQYPRLTIDNDKKIIFANIIIDIKKI